MTKPHDSSQNFGVFRDSFASALIEKIAGQRTKTRRRTKASRQNLPVPAAVVEADHDAARDGEELSEFIDYIATETFDAVPEELQTLTHYIWAESSTLQARYPLPLTGEHIASLLPTLDPSISDSLTTYSIIDGISQSVNEFLAPVLSSYISQVTAAPPPPISTKAQATECEICGRDWIPLTYHHLIPRFVHEKVLKRGWHRPEELENVAWLCGACHRFVHRFAGHERLAREFYTVELLLKEEEVRRFAEWVGRLRWKGR
jgi:hypothetical protein